MGDPGSKFPFINLKAFSPTRLDPSNSVVVIIDGLDETDLKQVRNIAEASSQVGVDVVKRCAAIQNPLASLSKGNHE